MENSYEKGKVFAVAGVTLLAAGLLAACSGSNTSKASSGEDKNYGYVYTDDPQTLDYTVSSKAATHDITTNVVDGLMANDKYGNLVPSLAEDWSVSKDGLTYTYKIRKGVKWYDADGEEHGEVTAKDFVTGLKHAADKKIGNSFTSSRLNQKAWMIMYKEKLQTLAKLVSKRLMITHFNTH